MSLRRTSCTDRCLPAGETLQCSPPLRRPSTDRAHPVPPATAVGSPPSGNGCHCCGRVEDAATLRTKFPRGADNVEIGYRGQWGINMTVTQHQSFCRVCHNACPIVVDIEGGRPVRVTGDPTSPTHHGYSCVKGRALPAIENAPTRLLHSMKRQADGSHSPIAVQQAVEEIGERLATILAEHGPRSVAVYAGTKLTQNPVGHPMSEAFLDAIGSPMRFTSNTIDQPGKAIAKGLHGYWMAPPQAFDDPDVVLFVGCNGLVSYTGVPTGDPGRFLKSVRARGGHVIVIDPRSTQLAKRASVHLQARAGEDVTVLAGLLRVILEEGLHDSAFLADNVDVVEVLRRAVEPFTPQYVARRADVAADDVVRAARIFAGARRGYAVGGTGPNMGNAHGTLVEYLILVLDTVCGHYLRAGERVKNPGSLIPTVSAKAQAAPPIQAFGFGEHLRVRGLRDTLAGLQTAALPEEILNPGDGQVKALFVLGGNPVAAFPDQLLTIEAMRALDLLVTLDVELSQTALLAHYVIAPTMSLEVPGFTQLSDMLLFYGNGVAGFTEAAAQYTPAVAQRPVGSDLIEEWELFYRVAAHLGLQLHLKGGIHFMPGSPAPVALNMTEPPTTDELLEVLAGNSRIPLSEIKQSPSVTLFPHPEVVVAPKDEGWTDRLNVGNADMMKDLTEIARSDDVTVPIGSGYDYRLLSRRLPHVLNSSHNLAATNRGRAHNLAYLHPDDLFELSLVEHDMVEISSARASITAFVAADPGLRRGNVSMAHAFGAGPERDADVREIGSSTSRLISVDVVFDKYSGQPLMSNIPVKIRPVVQQGTETFQ